MWGEEKRKEERKEMKIWVSYSLTSSVWVRSWVNFACLHFAAFFWVIVSTAAHLQLEIQGTHEIKYCSECNTKYKWSSKEHTLCPFTHWYFIANIGPTVIKIKNMLVEEIGLKEKQIRIPGFWTQAFKLVSYLKNKGGGTTFGLFLELLSVNLRYRKIELVLCYIPRQIKYYLQYQNNSCQPAFANELDTSWFSLLTCQTTESSWRDVKYSMPWCSMIQLVGNVNAACHCAQISSTSQTSSLYPPHKTEF